MCVVCVCVGVCVCVCVCVCVFEGQCKQLKAFNFVESVQFLPTVNLTPVYTSLAVANGQSWELEVFFEFFQQQKMIFCIFYQVNSLFLHQFYLKSSLPRQINLIKNAKNHFLLLKKFKSETETETESAQLCAVVNPKLFSVILEREINPLTPIRSYKAMFGP